MGQPDSWILSLEAQIRYQVELVAKLICEEECAIDSMRVLDSLTKELVTEEVAHQTVESRNLSSRIWHFPFWAESEELRREFRSAVAGCFRWWPGHSHLARQRSPRGSDIS